MTEHTDVATSWLQGLAARGVSVTIRNNRLWLHPATAHRNLTDDEVLTLRHHRQAIKDALRAGIPLHVVREAPIDEQATPTSKSAPSACKFCYQMPARCAALQTLDLERWRLLHALDPTEAARRTAEAEEQATTEMRVSIARARRGGRPCHCGDPSCTVSLFAHRRHTR